MNVTRQLLESQEVRGLSALLPGRNLLHLAGDYACFFVVLGAAVASFENREAWGLGPVLSGLIGVATVLISGAFLHRIALMGHEASHHLLVGNRRWNDILADLLCFFPIWSSLAHYRRKHGAHHRHPNVPREDPNLGSDRAEALFASFPMRSPRSVYKYYALFFWPPFVIGNLVDIFRLLVVGKSETAGAEEEGGGEKWARLAPGILGIAYLLGLLAVLQATLRFGSESALVGLPLLYHLLVGLGGVLLMPREWLERRGGNLSYPARVGAALRISFCAAILIGVTWARAFLGIHLGAYYFWFWLFPLVYVFPYLMLLREIYQHANLGTGTLDNSRIIHADPVTRWMLLPHGNDFHLIHHIYPTIPHYRLREAHEHLLESEAYRNELIQVRGNVHGGEDEPSVADSLADPARGGRAPAT